VFGFTLLVFLILITTCAEITVVMCYFQLCSEDYNWWWRSFLTSGSTAIYVFIYSAIYFSRLEVRTYYPIARLKSFDHHICNPCSPVRISLSLSHVQHFSCRIVAGHVGDVLAVLRLHGNAKPGHLPRHRHRGILLLPVVHEEDLR
jgi:hypothetical protein